MDEPWVPGISALAGAGSGVLGTILANLFLVGQRRAEATYQIVQAQRMVIEDLRAAYEIPWRPSTVSEWSGSESE